MNSLHNKNCCFWFTNEAKYILINVLWKKRLDDTQKFRQKKIAKTLDPFVQSWSYEFIAKPTCLLKWDFWLYSDGIFSDLCWKPSL